MGEDGTPVALKLQDHFFPRLGSRARLYLAVRRNAMESEDGLIGNRVTAAGRNGIAMIFRPGEE